MEDFYRLLGVSMNASEHEIKHSFRKMAKQYHPDINASAEAGDTFRMLYIAYDTLTDPFKRRVYDDIISGEGLHNRAHYETMQRRADMQARQYASMQFDQFEDTLFSKVSFHIKQVLAFVLFFAILCAAMVCFIIGTHYVFRETFNGAQVTGYGIWLGGGVLAYVSGRALLNIYEIWRS